MSSSVEQIKERLNIEEVIGSYIKLERAGNSLKARCPFHNEKTPSFFVSKDRNSYYCFGCGEKGDIFTFVQKFEGIDFLGSLKILADKAGIKLDRFEFKTSDKKDRLYTLLEAATIFLQNNLIGEEIPLDYLKKRGLAEKTIKDWRVGYVRDDWHTIYDYLTSKGFTNSEMERAGMIKTEGKNTYDRFRGRIMFPLFDSAGRVIAFSGRILHDDGKSAKYLNSPQTELFDKSKVLYGYDRAKQSIRKFDYSILVEGQMDLLMCHQAGFTNAVASSGTALTLEHLKLLQRNSNNIIMAFDSDKAGAKAADRADALVWNNLLSEGMEVKIAEIPGDSDPADLILKDKELFKNTLKNSIHLIDFLINRIKTQTNDKKKLWQLMRKDILPYIRVIASDTERMRYVKKISEIIEVKDTFIWEDLKNIKPETNIKENKTIDRELGGEGLKTGSAERSLAGILAWKNDEALKGKIGDIMEKQKFKEFTEEITKNSSELAFEAEEYYGNTDKHKLEKELKYLLLNLKEEIFKKELNNLLSELKKAEIEKNTDKAVSILKRCDEITKRLNEIRKEKNESS